MTSNTDTWSFLSVCRRLPCCLQFTDVGVFETVWQVKYYNYNKRDHCQWGNSFNSIEYECKPNDTRTLMWVNKELFVWALGPGLGWKRVRVRSCLCVCGAISLSLPVVERTFVLCACCQPTAIARVSCGLFCLRRKIETLLLCHVLIYGIIWFTYKGKIEVWKCETFNVTPLHEIKVKQRVWFCCCFSSFIVINFNAVSLWCVRTWSPSSVCTMWVHLCLCV